MRISGIDTVHVGPDHQFAGVDDMSDQRAGKVRAISAESSQAAIASGADKSGDHGNNSVGKEREQYVAPTAPGFLQLWPRLAKGVTSQNKVRCANRNRWNSDFFKCSGEDPTTEAFAVEGQAVVERGANGRERLLLRRPVLKHIVPEWI